MISNLEKVIVIIFQICSLLVLERPIPFALGLLTGSGLLGGTLESSWLQRLLSLPVWLIGLVGILVFDALRLDPHSFQMLLHSRQSLVIVIWLLALLLLLKGVQGNQGTPSLGKLPLDHQVLIRLLALVALQFLVFLPILRIMPPFVLPILGVPIKFQALFVIQAALIAWVGLNLSKGQCSLALLVFTLGSAGMVFSESRFLSYSLMPVLLLWWPVGGRWNKQIAFLGIVGQAAITVFFAVFSPLAVLAAPWIHTQFPVLASVLNVLTSIRYSQTWSFNFWAQFNIGHLNSSGLFKNWFDFLSTDYYESSFQKWRLLDGGKIESHQGHSHSSPIQELLGLQVSAQWSWVIAGLLAFTLAMAFLWFCWSKSKSKTSQLYSASAVVLTLACATTESASSKELIPIIVLLSLGLWILRDTDGPSYPRLSISPLASPLWIALPYGLFFSGYLLFTLLFN